MPRVTQKTIADKLGLSTSLVSRALSGKAGDIGCSPETASRIVETARRLGYVPSAAARQLRGGGGPVIGVVATDISDPFFSQVMTEVIRQAHDRGCALAVAGFERRQIHQRDLALLLQQDLSGLLLIGGGTDEGFDQLRERRIPVVRIGALTGKASFCQVGPDEKDGFRKLLHHLASLGHRRLGMIGADQPVHRARLAGARRLARARGMSVEPRHVVFGSPEVLKAGIEGGRRLIGQFGSPLPSALVCSSDAVAMGVVAALAEFGFRVPTDFSVTGFDDLMLSQVVAPPLTTLHQPVTEMINWALDALFGERPAKRPRPFPLGLKVRGSTATTHLR